MLPNLIERTKVAKSLMAIESWGIAKTIEAGKLEEIPLKGKIIYPQHYSYDAYSHTPRFCWTQKFKVYLQSVLLYFIAINALSEKSKL